MPILKPISGHTGLAKARDYLERGSRALARDFLNLDAPELASDEELPSYGEFDWAAVMDATRTEFGNDAAWGDRRARTYKHYIVSPDPRDAVGLSELRRVTMSWVRECFPEHEVAVVYHDDNERHIPHAHVIVNNTNLETGSRLRDPDPRALKRALQRIAGEHGLSAFADHESVPWQRRKVERAEREIVGKGEYSWVADIRERVAVARATTRTERDFVAMLGRMGVTVEPSRSREGDWAYSLSDTPTRRVTGTRLGAAYTRRGVMDELRSPSKIPASPETRNKIEEIARSAIELRSIAELNDLARAVSFVARGGASSIRELDRRISHTPDPDRRAQLTRLRGSCERYGLLPQTAPNPTNRRKPSQEPARNNRRSFDSGSHQRHHEQGRSSRGRQR
ncbi:MAG: relaxase/mobilization nuclease domain-containing protein [Atopobiaceae bacterium]|nr:relaxase/mobilization nuclease domain-containing protein [Atopobiaceae bacterium]